MGGTQSDYRCEFGYYSLTRKLVHIFNGAPVTDGDGVALIRYFGAEAMPMLDPLLLLDHFESEMKGNLGGGFPPHPHRGFETVTYMLEGRIRHKDNIGNEGVIEPGGVQWMTAGKGIVHSEMPEQKEGRMKGFQLWINLPSSHKMTAPKYQEFTVDQIPVEKTDGGGFIRVIAGETDSGLTGPVLNELTKPIYLDAALAAGEVFEQSLPDDHNAAVFMISGTATINDEEIETEQMGILSTGSTIEIAAGPDGSRFLLIAAKPLNEPVARGGPFVMNSEAEVHQAFADYRAGAL